MCGGFSSITLAYQAAEQITEATNNGAVPAEIIYIGDHDPAGVLIDHSIEKELRRHVDSDVELNFHRIAITPEQIEEYDLPTKPRKAKDKRSLHVKETVEAEAMPPNIAEHLNDVGGRLNDQGTAMVFSAAVLIAQADGEIVSEEEALLKSIYKALGLTKSQAKNIRGSMP